MHVKGGSRHPRHLPALANERSGARVITETTADPIAVSGSAPARGVVDGDLRLHGAANVHVADGSAVPSALGVNPQMTIMALALKAAETIDSRLA